MENKSQVEKAQDKKKKLSRNKKIIIVAVVTLAVALAGIIILIVHLSKRVGYDDGSEIEFREGCSDFYYGNLSENQQKMYRMLYKEAESILYGGKNATTLGVYRFSTYGLSRDEAVTAWYAFRYDAPEFFIISNDYLSLADSIEIKIAPEFRDAAVRQSVLNSISATVKQVESLMAGIEDEALKFKIIYDFVMDSTEYKSDAQGKDIFDGYSYSIAGPLDGNDATQSICQGYACAVSYLCNLFGIDCIYVGSAKLSHALNMVNIKDEWYYADATYDDKDASKYTYFLKKYSEHWRSAVSISGNVASDTLVKLLPQIKYGSNYDCKFQKDGIIYLMESRNRCSVVDCESSVTEAVIPQFVYNMQVKSIADKAFYYCLKLKRVIIPESVTSIGDYVFNYCYSLAEVDLGRVKTIGKYMFSNCRSLVSIDIPEDVTIIKEYAFENCSNLTKINIPDTIAMTYFSEGLFKNCACLASIDIPKSVTSIGKQTFSGCEGLTSIDIPAEVLSVGYRAFENCNKLTIYSQAFAKPAGWDNEWNCDDRFVVWNSANIQSGVTESGIQWLLDTDGLMAIAGYSGLQSEVEIPSQINSIAVTKILENIFYNRSDIISVDIPKSIEFIGENAFNVNDKLVAYCQASEEPSGWDEKWNNSYVTVVWGVSAGRHGITDDGFQWCFIGEEDIEITGYRGDLSKIKIPSEIDGIPVASINKGTFSGLSALVSVEIPASITKIPSDAFSGCGVIRVYCEAKSKPMGWAYDWDSFAIVTVIWDCKNNDMAEDGKIYVEIDGFDCVIKDGKAVIKMSGATYVTSVVIPASIDYKGNSYSVEIGIDAFRDCVNLTSVTISSGITSIGAHAFESCVKLQSVEIPSSVENIGVYAFYKCEQVKKIKIHFGVKYIGEWAFAYCNNLTELEISSSVISIGSYAFANDYRGDNYLKEIWIPKSVEIMGEYVFLFRSATVYCEAETQPAEWDEEWDIFGPEYYYGRNIRCFVFWNRKQGETEW